MIPHSTLAISHTIKNFDDNKMFLESPKERYITCNQK